MKLFIETMDYWTCLVTFPIGGYIGRESRMFRTLPLFIAPVQRPA